jgi:hypothetical protein
MLSLPKNTKYFLIKYRRFIIPFVPVVFFLSFLSLTLAPSPEEEPLPAATPAITQTPRENPNIPLHTGLEKEARDGEITEPLENFEGLEKKETLPDGTLKYTYSSPVRNRPNIIIARENEEAIFQSSVTHPDFPVKITNYTNRYGAPKWVFKGSNFYGKDVQTFIYPELGIAFIANPNTQDVFEQHLFESMSVEEYVRKYGDDIPANPEP